MRYVTASELARLSGRTRAAVNKAIRDHRLPRTVDGLIDTAHPTVRLFHSKAKVEGLDTEPLPEPPQLPASMVEAAVMSFEAMETAFDEFFDSLSEKDLFKLKTDLTAFGVSSGSTWKEIRERYLELEDWENRSQEERDNFHATAGALRVQVGQTPFRISWPEDPEEAREKLKRVLHQVNRRAIAEIKSSAPEE